MRMKQHKHLLPTSKASGHLSMPAMSIDDTLTEPATSPRVMEVPVLRWAPELQLPTLEQGPREEPERFATRYILNDGTMRRMMHCCAKQPRHSTTKTCKGSSMMLWQGSKQHMNEVSESGKQEMQPRNSGIIRIFHMVHRRQELRLCEHFQMSMQHYVRMTLLMLHSLNQSSRKLRPPQEGRFQKASILTRNLRRLVYLCSLHHQRHLNQMQLKV